MRRLLIVGCGDVALRLAPMLRGRYRVFGLARTGARIDLLRLRGIIPVAGDLDAPESLRRLAGLGEDVIHLAPPPGGGNADTRTRALIRALGRAAPPRRLVYVSTSGVYGDCGGASVSETRPPHPESDRARRRADAEAVLRSWGRAAGVTVSILRVPGIYAGDRLPLERLRTGTPALRPGCDPYTNHVHAEDLARIIRAALSRGRAGRAYNAVDDSGLRMGEYFDLVADHFGLQRPPRVDWQTASATLSAALLSFMRESRRLDNRRMKRELRVRLRYPTVAHGLAAA